MLGAPDLALQEQQHCRQATMSAAHTAGPAVLSNQECLQVDMRSASERLAQAHNDAIHPALSVRPALTGHSTPHHEMPLCRPTAPGPISTAFLAPG